MMRTSASIGLMLSSLIALGCGGAANPHKVHEASLIDNKVLERRVELALHNAGHDFQSVHAQADSGTVTLSGTVASADARAKAEGISSGVYGVKKTDNELSVTTSATAR